MTNPENDDEEEKVESTLFEDLDRIQREQEKEDLETLGESNGESFEELTEDEKINQVQKLFLNDGKLDYDIKSPINFKIGEEAEHFNLKAEELDRFSEIYEYLYKLGFSQAVYNKSLRDQIKQKGNKVDISKAVSTWESMLDKLCDIKMLSFLCDLVEIPSDVKNKIMDKTVDRFFEKPTINVHKDTTAENNIMDQLKSITKKLNRAGV